MTLQQNQSVRYEQPIQASSSSGSNEVLEKPFTRSLEKNPLAGLSHDALLADADCLVDRHDLVEHRDAFRKGALLASAQNKNEGYDGINLLTAEEKAACQFEIDHRAKSLACKQILQAALCAACAVVQGMDQTVINGAQEFYFAEFGITKPLLKGFINSSPYCAAALVGCFLNQWLNKRFGRRGTIFISCFIAMVTAFWQAAANNGAVFVAGRLVLGLAVGAKSATVPVYAAECSPAAIRGALTMLWQTFTAFGIMLGYAVSLAFQNVDVLGENTQWRWMLGITALPPLFVCAVVYALPESPRYYLEEKDYAKAFRSMRALRREDFLAARDLYLAHKHIEAHEKLTSSGANSKLKEFMTRRNLRAAQSSYFCMFMQQFCGVNVIAYYSTVIFMEAGFSRNISLIVSLGCGITNFLGALPALYTIDKFGRRRLLLITFPFLALCLFWAGGSFYIPEMKTRVASVCTALYVFMLFYSPGMGPVPFTYSAEAFSLSLRPIGMASATAITWAFNFLINFTWPMMMEAMTPAGGFCFYAAWNAFAWFFTYFLLPETKNLSLEALDGVFEERNRDHAKRKWLAMKSWWCKVRGKDVDPAPIEVISSVREAELPTDSTESAQKVERQV